MSTSSKLASAAIGGMFFTAFGTLWLTLGVLQSSWSKLLLLPTIIFIGGLLFTFSLRQFQTHKAAYRNEANTPERRRISRIFNIVNTVQWCLAGLLAFMFSNFGYDRWIVPMIIFIVGAHFLPLAKVFENRRHYLTGLGLMIVALVYPWILSEGPINPFGPCVAGLILWLSAASTLLFPMPGQPLTLR
jgi:hypothetical protein